MKTTFKIRSGFEVHLCFTEPGGNEVQAFEIHHAWMLPECRPGMLGGDEQLLRAEANLFSEDWEPVTFQVRQGQQGLDARRGTWMRFGPPKNRNRFRVVAQGSGGNWYWEVIRFRSGHVPHVLNWLRRQRHFSKTEWVSDFMEVWESRRAIDAAKLREYSTASIKHNLKVLAAEAGVTPGQLIAMSLKPKEDYEQS